MFLFPYSWSQADTLTVVPVSDVQLSFYPEIKKYRDQLNGCLSDNAYAGISDNIHMVLHQTTLSELDFKSILELIGRFVSNGLYVEQYLKICKV